jgi:L,D-peptidoglycan transpeptidase YkuD (ErfK/YbiS/YcfS/YnhG family)
MAVGMRSRPRRPGCIAASVATLVSILVALVVPSDGRAAAASACAGGATAVVVDTRAHALSLCAAGRAAETFRVALGSGGVGKRRAGDNRTPLGSYPLGAPRASRLFGTFIPVGYPTVAQARAGMTGGAVGIHGPARGFEHAGLLNTATDWTAGCIAVGSDAEIGRIAAWIRAHRAAVRID